MIVGLTLCAQHDYLCLEGGAHGAGLGRAGWGCCRGISFVSRAVEEKIWLYSAEGMYAGCKSRS